MKDFGKYLVVIASYVMIWLLLIIFVIGIHEYGHLRAFQKNNIPVQEFSLGFGWLIYQYQHKDLAISLRAIPLGGCVKTSDEADKLLIQKPFWTKINIYSAGAVNNLTLALIIIFASQILGWLKGNLSGRELIKTALCTPMKLIIRYIILIVESLTFGRIKFAFTKYFYLSTGKIKLPQNLYFFMILNLALGLLNIMPILPLDGGWIAIELIPPSLAHYVSGNLFDIISVIALALFIISVNIQNLKFLDIEQEEAEKKERLENEKLDLNILLDICEATDREGIIALIKLINLLIERKAEFLLKKFNKLGGCKKYKFYYEFYYLETAKEENKELLLVVIKLYLNYRQLWRGPVLANTVGRDEIDKYLEKIKTIFSESILLDPRRSIKIIINQNYYKL